MAHLRDHSDSDLKRLKLRMRRELERNDTDLMTIVANMMVTVQAMLEESIRKDERRNKPEGPAGV